jgi:hypothetical protein
MAFDPRLLPGGSAEPYHFGDVTRMVIRWLGPHTRAVRGRIDWLKFGQTLVLAFVVGQTVNLGTVIAALTDSIKDPDLTAALPAIAAGATAVVDLIRRLRHDARDLDGTPSTHHGQEEDDPRRTSLG